jgi:hypothetical protein
MLDVPSSDWMERTEFEAAVPFRYAADVVLGSRLRDPEQRRKFANRVMTGRIENWRMTGVTLFPALGLVFRDGHAVDLTRYNILDGEEARAVRYLEGPRGQMRGRCFFGGSPRHTGNHFHMLHQSLPAIAAYAGCPGFRDGVLLLTDPPPNLYRGMELAGIDAPEVVELDRLRPLEIEELSYSSFLTEFDGISPFALSLYDRMIAGVVAREPRGCAPPGDQVAGGQMIYIYRADTPARPMRNEDELVERLARRFGVRAFILGTLSLDEQIRLFHASRIVIGPHGAGLGNVVFCKPRTVLYELLPDHYLNSCVNRLAQLRGLHYWCDVHRADQRPGLWRHQTPWTVDIDAVERRVADILSVYARETVVA